MKEIIFNEDNIKDEELTTKIRINNLLIINSKNEILMQKRYNTYYFIHDYDVDVICGIDLKKYSPFLVRKKYISDYPLMGDKTLYEYYYYKINTDLVLENVEYISLNSVRNIIENSRYDNPRTQEVTNEILEALDYLFASSEIQCTF